MPTAKINDLQVYYEVYGEGDSLLLVAGLGSAVRLFVKSAPIFAERRKVISFDNRGAGRTDKPDIPYTIEMMADDAAGLLRFLRVPRADILGVSMGGRIAMDLAIRHPEMVRRLILVSTSARVTKESRRSLGFRLGRLAKRVTGSGAFRSAQPYYAFRRQLDASGKYDCTRRLGGIASPTLIMRGDRDSLAPKALVDELHAGIKGSRLLEFKGGHIFFVWNKNEEFTDAATEFLEGVGPRRSSRAG